MIIKNCLTCNNKFIKNYNCSKIQWEKTKFCSKKCYYKSKLGHKGYWLGKKRSQAVKDTIRKANIGQIPWNKGIPCSEDTKKKISQHRRGYPKSPKAYCFPKGKENNNYGKDMSGFKNYNWKGGKSFELYGLDWTKLLKHSIRTRDSFVCKICEKNGWMVHHIDYNKKNNNPNNLITLCHKCHSKTNGNRKYWIEYFKN